MRRHLFVLIPIVLAVSSCFVNFSQATDLFDTISKSLSDAGDAIVETSESQLNRKSSGWANVYRLNIVDKDWWIERMSGGNSPVKAKYIAAAALTKGDDGNYFYKHCTFYQDKLITGAFGPLYLSHQGEAVPIVKKNIDK